MSSAPRGCSQLLAAWGSPAWPLNTSKLVRQRERESEREREEGREEGGEGGGGRGEMTCIVTEAYKTQMLYDPIKCVSAERK